MANLSDYLANNPNVFIVVLIGVLFLFLVVFIAIKIRTNQKKNESRRMGAFAELIFDETVRLASKLITDRQFQGYKLYSVNGIEPEILGKSIFTPEGSCRIEIQYIDTGYATRRISLTTVHEMQLLEFPVQKGSKYRIRFVEKTEMFVVN